jgi:hypothetical protein
VVVGVVQGQSRNHIAGLNGSRSAVMD